MMAWSILRRQCWLYSLMLAGLAGLLLEGCQNSPDLKVTLSPAELVRAQHEDAAVLKRIHSQNTTIRSELTVLKSAGGWQKRGYFSAQESNQLEFLLYRFHENHRTLIEIIDRYRSESLVNGENSTESAASPKSQRLRTKAHQELIHQAKFIVDTFESDDVAINKINQRYPRLGVPRHTYDRLDDLMKSGPERQVSQLGRQVEDSWNDSSYDLQAELVTQVGRFKNPSAHLIKFSETQKKQIMAKLQPGDVILSYTAGYASTIFIPGSFKHAMVYVGTLEQRRQVGLVPESVQAKLGSTAKGKLIEDLKQDTTHEGRPANVIEAVFSGVRLSDLNNIMGTHVNRMVVLRPRLHPNDRVQYLTQIFSYLGQDYDFRFDFADSSRQVCTEIIYRALNGMNGIDFALSRHTGYLTLSSDDIINYWLNKRPDAFDFVLYVDEAALSPQHAARVRTGKAGKRRLKRQMIQ